MPAALSGKPATHWQCKRPRQQPVDQWHPAILVCWPTPRRRPASPGAALLRAGFLGPAHAPAARGPLSGAGAAPPAAAYGKERATGQQAGGGGTPCGGPARGQRRRRHSDGRQEGGAASAPCGGAASSRRSAASRGWNGGGRQLGRAAAHRFRLSIEFSSLLESLSL